MFDSTNSFHSAVPGRRRTLAAATAAACLMLGSGAALAQTAFGASTSIVLPLIANTGTFTSEVTLFNSNPADVTVAIGYYDANNLPSPGAKTCSDVVIPANRSVQFSLSGQCTLEAGSHFGVLTASDVAGTNAIFGYSRVQNNAGAGFSVEGFPAANFATDTSNSTGLKSMAAAPTYQTNCFVGSLGDPLTYDLKLFDGSTGAQVGSTISGSLGSYEQFRYLDIFTAASAPAGDYTNVRAEFTRTSAGTQQMIGFCTVQDNLSFGADFRIAKSATPPAPPPVGVATIPWAGPMVTLYSNTLVYIFMGPTAVVNLPASGSVSAFGSGSMSRQTGSPVSVSVGVCYQNQTGPGPITPLGSPTSVDVGTTEISYGASGSAVLPAGTYNVGFCAKNNSAGSVNKNGNTSGFVVVTP
jgi:hypothetical protein